MPEMRNYANLTIQRDAYEQMRDDYEKLGLKESFNQWVVRVCQSALEKEKILKKFDKMIVAGIDEKGFAILDTKEKEIVHIHYDDGFVCSVDKKQPCDHKIFASLNPYFVI